MPYLWGGISAVLVGRYFSRTCGAVFQPYLWGGISARDQAAQILERGRSPCFLRAQEMTTDGSRVLLRRRNTRPFDVFFLISDTEMELSFPATSWKSKENPFIFSVSVPFFLSVSPSMNAVQPSAF
jgi:hypothetical protein